MLAVQVLDTPETLQLYEVPLPSLPPGGALLRVTGCGLCGSDVEKLVNQKAPPGTVLGHEVVGVIQALDEDHGSPFSVGDRIVSAHHVPCGSCQYCVNQSPSMCRMFKTTNIFPGGFAEVIALSQAHLQQVAFAIPARVSDAEASCVEPLACVLRAVQRGGPLQKGSVAVIGLGFIGLLAAQVYQNRGDRVYGFDRLAERCRLALHEGFLHQAFLSDEVEAAQALLKAETDAGGVDTVFLSVVNAVTVQMALDLIRDGGTLVLFASDLAGRTTLNLNDLYFRELTVVPSYSPSVESLKESAQAIFEGTVRTQPLVSHTLPLARLAEAVTLYREGKALKVLMTMDAGGAS